MPDLLFDYGTRLGRLLQLEQVCRKAAISLAPIVNNERLFLNINPQTLNDPSFVKGRTKDWALTKGLKPSQIVFEITEHEAIEDYETFRKTINHYRAQGFLIAIDDMGAGYSGLLTLVELTPDYIKLDRGLISNIDTEPSKQAMVEAMVMVAHKIGAQTIAEGIETVQELAVVSALGADYGQGFLLGRPSPIITAIAATT
jgi:EAL domain-containing protein (putative c-di-GMP-specific phosphodiesterase class I)